MDFIVSWFQSFLSVIKTFEIKDVIDIVCVTFIIYALIKFVKDTKAVQLLKGAAILIGIYFVSSFLNLTMFSAILRTFMEFGVLILIIIFQPEIRNVLEKIGRSKISRYFGISNQDEAEKLYEETKRCVNAVVSVSKSFSNKKSLSSDSFFLLYLRFLSVSTLP